MRVQRTDYRYIFQPENYDDEKALGFLTPFSQTEEGFLTGRAVVTNVGVFPYVQADGSIRSELRLPEEVFHEDSLKTLALKPLTDDHPTTKVTPANAKELQVGSLGEELKTDAYRVSAPISITRKDTIDRILNGKRALSCGYDCDVEITSGTWMGMDYDAIQRNIRYNHVAVVDAGRAGDDAVMRFDSRGEVIKAKAKKTEAVASQHKEDAGMKAFKFDNKEYAEESEVILALGEQKSALDALKAELQEIKDSLAKAEGERDSAKDELEQVKKDLSEAQDATKLDEAVNARLAFVKSVEGTGIEFKGDVKEAREAVILKAFPKAELEGKSDAYVSARFDSALEVLASQQEKQESVEKVAQENKSAVATEEKLDRVDMARKAYLDHLQNNWKKEQ